MAHPTLPSMYLIAPRVALGVAALTSQAEARPVLIAIVKGAFAADDPSATLLPADQQPPLLLKDVYFNLARNAEFSAGEQRDADDNLITAVAGWQTNGPTIAQVLDAGLDFMRVSGAGRAEQPLQFEQPLGGRIFRLRFQARATAPGGATSITVSGIGLEAKSGALLLAGDRTVPVGAFGAFDTIGAWPAELADVEATLLLAGSSAGTIDYDQINLTEGAADVPYTTDDLIRYEHDLASYKPRADIVVLGTPAPPEPGPTGGTWTEEVSLGGTVMNGSFTATTTPVTFGWESRAKSATRKGYAGDAEHFDPRTMVLPIGFNNLFFNGGKYIGAQPAFTHPAGPAVVEVRSSGSYPNGGGGTEIHTQTQRLRLPPAPQTTLSYRTGDAPDAPEVQQTLAMRADTIVYDKGTGRFYVVWRGVEDARLALRPGARLELK